ncbi:MAG: hypothetical protein ACRELT_12070, partial [Longimicrobiales bacterium]
MKKVIILVLALALIWAIPGLRQRVGVATLPLLERLGPVGEWAVNPVRGIKARNQESFFLRILNDDRAEGRTLPDAGTFQDWIRRRTPEETGMDPWGKPYWLRRNGSVYT